MARDQASLVTAILRTLDHDFRQDLGILNLKQVTQISHQQIYNYQLDAGIIQQQSNPEDPGNGSSAISQNQLSLMVFLVTSGD